jgi:hypothetical protein
VLGINSSGHVSRVVLTDTTTDLTNAPSGGLDAAGVRAAIGLAAANLDGQLDDILTEATSANNSAGTASANTTTLTTRLSATRAGYLDNLSAGAVAQQSTLTTLSGYVDTEVAAIKTVTDKVDTTLELDGSVWRGTVNYFENAPAGEGGGGSTTVNVLPYQINLKRPDYIITLDGDAAADIEAFQSTTPTYSFGVFQADGTPVTLTGKTIRMLFIGPDGATFGKLETSGSGITVSGNTITATVTDTITSAVRDAVYQIRNVTDKQVYREARFNIKQSPTDHT